MKHPSNFLCIGDQCCRIRLTNKFHPPSNNQLGLQLRTRGVCSPQVLDVRGRRVSRESFGDVRRNRQGRLARLIPEGRLLVSGKSSGQSVTSHREVHRLLPDQEIAEGFNLRHGAMSSTRDAMRILFAYQYERRETWQVLPGEIASHLAESAYLCPCSLFLDQPLGLRP